MHFTTAALLAILAGLSHASLGINCRGSGLCSNSGGTMIGVHDGLGQLINAGHSKRHYAQGQQIACSGHLCAFFQNLPGGENVQVAYDKVGDLIKHGCKGCGSCPTKPGNDVSTGELTVNYVQNPCCHGSNCYCL